MKKSFTKKIPLNLYHLYCTLCDLHSWSYSNYPDIEKSISDLELKLIDIFDGDTDFENYESDNIYVAFHFKKIL